MATITKIEDRLKISLQRSGLSDQLACSVEQDSSKDSVMVLYQFEDSMTVISTWIDGSDSARVQMAKLDDFTEQLRKTVDERVTKLTGKYYPPPQQLDERRQAQPQGWHGYFGDAGGPLR